MLKKAVCIVLCVCCVIACSSCQTSRLQDGTATARINYAQNMKAVWLSYYEIGDIFLPLGEAQAKEKLAEMFSDLHEKGINTVFFHVRAFADALYASKVFPLSAYCPQGYDLLALAVEAAHANELSLQAWVNPYRVALHQALSSLKKDSPARKLYSKDKSALLFYEDSIYLNPASTAAQRLILSGIRELAQNYEIDGIHFDDYFYPSAEKSLDKAAFSRYQKSGGRLPLEDYRRENVNTLIESVHVLLKQINQNLLFGISPQASAERNKNELFADTLFWAKNAWVDYLMPQIYFGFENESSPFEACVENWCAALEKSSCALYCGLALYKSGKNDEYASAEHSENSAYAEWRKNDDIIARQIRFLNQKDAVKGYGLFSYSSLTGGDGNACLQNEIRHLLPLLKGQ